MTTMTQRQNEHLATALVLEGCETGRRLESIIAAEKALRTDPRCPEAMLVVMDQDEVRQLVSSDYVRLGLSKAVLDESERRLNRGKRRPDEEDPGERRVMESAFRRAAKAYAACLSELGHHGEASHVYSSLTRRLPAEGREAAYLTAILDLRHGNRAGFARLKRNLAGDEHPNWIFTDILATLLDGDPKAARTKLTAVAASLGYVGRVLCSTDDPSVMETREEAAWAGSEIHRLWRSQPTACRWLEQELDGLGC